MTPCCQVDSTMREVNSINIALGHLSLKITSKKLGEEKALFDYFDKS